MKPNFLGFINRPWKWRAFFQQFIEMQGVLIRIINVAWLKYCKNESVSLFWTKFSLFRGFHRSAVKLPAFFDQSIEVQAGCCDTGATTIVLIWNGEDCRYYFPRSQLNHLNNRGFLQMNCENARHFPVNLLRCRTFWYRLLTIVWPWNR